MSPVWSPDGGQIAFSGWRNGSYQILVMPADGNTSPVSLSAKERTGVANDLDPAW